MKIYLAGALFTEEEKIVLRLIAKALRDYGHEVYVPMENGVIGAWDLSNPAWALALFGKDVDGINWSDMVVSVYNGMDSDSGTSWEIGYAYGIKKPCVVFHNYDTTKIHSSLMVYNGAIHNVGNIGDLLKYFARPMPVFTPYQS